MNLPAKVTIYLLILSVAAGAACAGKIRLNDPVRLPDDQLLKAVYFFPHWDDPWKSDDAAVSGDLKKIRESGFNTVCLDHEVSQAVDREWYWLDREYKLASQERMYILPWLQLQAVDRVGLMKFSHLQLKRAVNQDKEPEEDYVDFRDKEFRKALAHYVSVYLDRYASDPALLKMKVGKATRPVVGLMVEAGWRNGSGLPLSFDEDTNAYFRKWMRAMYHDLNELNSKWGTSYKSFDEIDPCDKAVFDYAFPDKQNMPMAVREHVQFRARLINDALQDVAEQVRKRHKDVLFVAEVAYPFGADDPNAASYRWNNANSYRAVDFADVIFIRTTGGTCSRQMEKEQDVMMTNGKRVILAYRLSAGSGPERAVASALDCASCANGLAYYNWNETADDSSAAYNKPDVQSLVRLMTSTYDVLYDPDKRHMPATSAEAPSTTVTAPVTVSPSPVTAPSDLAQPPVEGEIPPVPVSPEPISPVPPEDSSTTNI